MDSTKSLARQAVVGHEPLRDDDARGTDRAFHAHVHTPFAQRAARSRAPSMRASAAACVAAHHLTSFKARQQGGNNYSYSQGGGRSQPNGGSSRQGREQADSFSGGARSDPRVARLSTPGGDLSSRDPRLAAFRKMQAPHLPRSSAGSKVPDNVKTCSFYAVHGSCPLDNCSYKHELPTWFNRNSFLANHQ